MTVVPEVQALSKSLVLTLIAPDQPGLVEALSQALTDHGGNWLQSRMSHLAGQFAGILSCTVPGDRSEAFLGALRELESRGLRFTVEGSGEAPAATTEARSFHLELVGNDRPGIVREISHALAQRGVNVEELDTECTSAPMTGETLFKAEARLSVPTTADLDALRRDLEAIANDLMVELALAEAE